MLCPCCSGKNYSKCCEPFHVKKKIPTSAEQLMRSRYCAYAFPNGDYLMETTLPSERKNHDKSEMEAWGKANQWTKLEIIAKPSTNKIEFKAYYINSTGKEQVHHELSAFRKIQNRWFYVSGEFLD